MFASRLVLVLDELEQRGLVERRQSPTDRRSYALDLTSAGEKLLHEIGRVAREHEDALCAALDESERTSLTEFLTRIAAEQQLVPGVHPGYRRLGAAVAEADGAVGQLDKAPRAAPAKRRRRGPG
jgi:hypothetical protein